MEVSRRRFIEGTGVLATAVAASAVSGRAAHAALPEAPIQKSPSMQPPLVPNEGPDYNPVVTLNGWTLPWRMKEGWKEFHLVAEPVEREMAPGMKAYLWGYNGQSPGPTIEAVEGVLEMRELLNQGQWQKLGQVWRTTKQRIAALERDLAEFLVAS